MEPPIKTATDFRPFRVGDEVTLQLCRGRTYWRNGTILAALFQKQYIFTVCKDEEDNGLVLLTNERDPQKPWYINAAFLRLERASTKQETFKIKEDATTFSIASDLTGRIVAIYPKTAPSALARATAELNNLNNNQ